MDKNLFLDMSTLLVLQDISPFDKEWIDCQM